MQIQAHLQRKTYADYKRRQQESAFPEDVVMQNIQVTGENYEVTGPKKWGAELVGWIRMFCFIFMFAGEMIISSLGGINSMPDFVKDAHGYVQENKLKFGMMAFLLGSMI